MIIIFWRDQMPYKDKEKRIEYQKKWYAKNRKKQIKATGLRRNVQRKKMQQFIFEDKKSKGCYKCDEDEPYCLDYHHTDEDKEIEVSIAVNRAWSKERIQKEIDKCILVCANCHRKIHARLITLVYEM